MDYHKYLAEDFAADEDFKEWVIEPTPENGRFWRNFLREYPERFDYLEEGRRLVLGLQRIHPTPADTTANLSFPITLTIWSRIEATLAELEAPASRSIPWKLPLSIAASVIMVLSIGWLAWNYGAPETTLAEQEKLVVLANEWTESVNSADNIMDIQLSDGSRVKLGKNSRLKHPQKFEGKQREVFLTGEAFFEVVRNSESPFLVHANSVVTKVLGTSFEIKAFADAPDVTVAVKTGRVSVYADTPNGRQDPEADGIVLTPNQKAIFKRSDATIRKEVVEKPILLVPSEEKVLFVYDEAPAAKVFADMSRAYGIEVIYDEEAFKKCMLTLNLTEENMYQKLEVICKVLNAEYKLIDGQVIIYSRGC